MLAPTTNSCELLQCNWPKGNGPSITFNLKPSTSFFRPFSPWQTPQPSVPNKQQAHHVFLTSPLSQVAACFQPCADLVLPHLVFFLFSDSPVFLQGLRVASLPSLGFEPSQSPLPPLFASHSEGPSWSGAGVFHMEIVSSRSTSKSHKCAQTPGSNDVFTFSFVGHFL